MKSRIIAVSAIAAAFTAVILTVGTYFDLVDLVCMVVSSVFICMPLALKSYKGAVLGYLAGGTIASIATLPKLFSGFAVVIIAYFFFFGIFPIIKAKADEKKISAVLRTAIGLVWFLSTVYGVYLYYRFIIGLDSVDFLNRIRDYIYLILGVVGVAFYFVYTRFVYLSGLLIGKYLSRYYKDKW